MRKATIRATILCALLFGAASSSLAQETPPPAIGVIVETCAAASPASEASDQQALQTAMDDMQRSGFPGLAAHLETLRGVLERAPACYPQIENRDGQTMVRAADMPEFLLISALLATREGGSGQLEMVPNTYADVSLFLGSFAVESHDFDAALSYLDRGLSLQPANQYLILERVSALMGLQRMAEAEAAVRAALDIPSLTINRARLLRRHGVILIELNRLDEAEAALNESIALEPNNPGARNELQYIADLRRGRGERRLEMTAPASQPQ